LKRKEGAFWIVQALIVAGVLALVALPSSNSSGPSPGLGGSVDVTATTYTGNQVPNVPFPFKYALFMVPPDLPEFPGCAGGYCFDTNWSEAILFDCPNAMSHGCTVNIYNSHDKANYSIVASSFPKVGQPNEPGWANCSWETYTLSPVPGVQPELYGVGGFFGYCDPVGSSAFVISIYQPCPVISISCGGAGP
jgi:hypothetical protein